ncbi:phosphatidylinositol-binding protein scs2 [Ceratobasidium sp. 370]|nr:phosphatidylinositol-binding protein scs2 [Ceratobasidium sp. 370]
MREDPPLSHKCKDKFLIQSMILTPEIQSKPTHDIWKFDEEEEAPSIHRQKIKVVYLPPAGRTTEQDCTDGANCWARRISQEDLFRHLGCLPGATLPPSSLGIGVTREARASPVPFLPVPTPVVSSRPSPTPSPPPQEEGKIVRSQSPGKDHTIVEEVVTYSQTIEPPTDEQPNIVNINVVAPSNPSTPDPASVPAPVRDPSKDVAFAELNQRYAETQVEINQLQGLLASVPPKIRRDTVMGDGEDTVVSDVGKGWTIVELDPTTVQQSEGVPLQMVMPIALGVFATTYLFF